jgi:hypothetical protein
MPFKHPAYLILFLVLITPLGIAAQSLGLGTDGLFLCVLAALGGTLAVPFLLRLIRAHLAASLDGKPSLLEFLLGPPGYHHPLMLEGPDDEVIGTDLVVDAHDEENALSPTPTPAAASKIALIARNPRNALYLAPTFCPDVDDLVGEGIVGFGSKGSGKTNLGALLTEQFGRFYLPMAIFDIEGDYLSLVDTPPPVLPHGMIAGHPEAYAQFPDERFLAVDAENAALIGYTILEEGMQTVFALRTWANDDERARIMIQVIKGLTAWADEQPPESRVPCLLFLDEAARWLPQDSRLSNLGDAALFADLQRAFIETATMGRKRGLTPCFFNQRIADLDKRVMAQANLYFLGKQRLDIDLKRYMQYVNADIATPRQIAAFAPGQFIVSLADGTQFITTFYERRSRHTSHAPRVTTALKRYGEEGTTPVSPLFLPAASPKTPAAVQRPPETTGAPPPPTHTVEQRSTPQRLSVRLERALVAWNKGHSSVRKLARALGVTHHQARDLIDELDRYGLIEKNKPGYEHR